MGAKRLSIIIRLLVAASLCAACVLLGVENQDALVTFRAAAPQLGLPGIYSKLTSPSQGACREFIIDADGSVVLLADDISRWREGKWSPADYASPEGKVFDAVQAPDGKWFIVTQRSYLEALLYQYDGSGIRQVAAIRGRFRDAITLHLAPDGTVWIATKDSAIYGFRDGKTVAHELLPGIPSSRVDYSAFSPPIISLPIPGRGLWFWSPADYRADRNAESWAVKGFQVLDEGQWRAVSPSSGLLGGATAIDSNAILFASRYKGIFSISAADDSIKDVDWKLPDKDGYIFLHSTPSHHVLAITAEPVASSKLARSPEGAIGKLVVFENGRPRVLLEGIDYSEANFDKGRPVVDTPQGTFIATVGGGLLFVSPDASQARRFDWRFNVPTMSVDRMRIQGNRLFLLDRNKGLAVVDWARLLRMPEAPAKKDRWDLYMTSTDFTVASDGAIWWFDRSREPGQLNCWRNGKLTHVSLEGIQLERSPFCYVAVDTKGGIWLIPNPTATAIAFFNNGKWQTFSQPDEAWRSMALEERNNPSFGFAGSCNVCPVFGGNGRVAYRDSSGRARYFDGLAWQTIPSSPPNESFYGDSRLFFENGILTARYSKGYYQFMEGQWKLRSEEMVRSTDMQPPAVRGPKVVPPVSFPGDKDRCTIWFKDTADTVWMGNSEELYRGMEDAWVRFPTIGTPLFAAENIASARMDESGDLWFALQNGTFSQLAHYRDSGKTAALEWLKPPAAMITTSRAVFSCRVSETMDGRSMLRYRVDGGAWKQIPLTASQQEIVVENLPNGMHKVEMRAFDELLQLSRLLSSTFEVQHDYGADIKDLIPQLSDSSKREAAARSLVAIGKSAVPALTDRMEKADSRLRWWIQAILDEIGRNENRK
jgi:hypothetical protein